MHSFKNCSSSFQNSSKKRPAKRCVVMFIRFFFLSFCHFPLLINSFFTHSVAVLPSYAPGRSLKSTDCLLLSKSKMQTNGLVSHWIFFLLLLSRLLWTSRCPEKLREKTFSAATLFFHMLSLLSSLVSFQCFSSYHIKQTIRSK